jgi:hypothetical protein
MKKVKKYIIIISIFLLLLFVNNVTADEKIADNIDDAYHYYFDGIAGNFRWKNATSDIPNIDITELSFCIIDNVATFSITVEGSIEDSKYIGYFGSYTDDEASYNFSYTDRQVKGIAINPETSMFNDRFNFSILNNTLHVMVNSIGGETGNVEFYGYAYYALNGSIEAGEFWIDYAPDSYFPDETDNDPEGYENIDDTSKKTPGFELLSMIVALCVAFFIFRMRK